MSSTSSATAVIVDRAVRRDRAILVAAIGLLTVLAWIYLLHLGSGMAVGEADASGMGSMPGMDMSRDVAAAVAPGFRPWGVAGFGLVLLMWVVMMAGMMLPSATPMVLLYAASARRSRGTHTLASTSWFVAGYLAVWTLFSLAATSAQWALTRAALLTPMMASASGMLGGALLIGAGLYQWTPYKRACLAHCQTPLGLVLQHGGFRPGAWGALREGASHGAHCVGCCALLMTLLFVGGVMNVLWIAGLSILVLVEKIWVNAWVARVAGAALAAGGILALFR